MKTQYETVLENEPKMRLSSKITIAVIAFIIIISMATTSLPKQQSEASINVARNVMHGLVTPSPDKLFSLQIDAFPFRLFL